MEQTRGARGVAERGITHETIYEDIQPSYDWTHDPKCHVLLIDLPGYKKEELKVRVDNFGKITISGERWLSENKYQRFKQVFDMPEDSESDSISGRFDGGLLFIIIPKKELGKVEPKQENQTAMNEIEEEKKDDKNVTQGVPKTDHVNKQDHGPDVRNEMKEESNRNAQQGLEEDAKDNINMEKKQESEQTGRKEGFSVGRMHKKEDWRMMAEKVKNKEEIEVMMRSAMENIMKNKRVIITVMLAFSVGAYISYKFK